MSREDEIAADAEIQEGLARGGYDPHDPFCRAYLERLQKTAYGELIRRHKASELFAFAAHYGVPGLPCPAPEWHDDVNLVLEAATVYAAPVWLRTRARCWIPDGQHLSLLGFFITHVLRNDFRVLYFEHCRRQYSARLQIYMCLGRCSGPEVYDVGRLWALGNNLKQISKEVDRSSDMVRRRWEALKQHLEEQHNITIKENP